MKTKGYIYTGSKIIKKMVKINSRKVVLLSVSEYSVGAGDLGLIPGSGRSSGEGNGNPFQYSCLENPMDEEPGGLHPMGLQRVGKD